jgi:putative pyruvate formate lyase activating enzyme
MSAFHDLFRSQALSEKSARKSLPRYFAVMQNEKPAKFLIAKKIAVEFDSNDSIDVLWEKHAKLTKDFRMVEKQVDRARGNLQGMQTPEKSYLDLKVEIAKRILGDCQFCSRSCHVNRLAGELGYCGCGTQIAVSSIFPHMGEEPELVPSGTIFTLGCTMRCLHCQNWEISQWVEAGEFYKPNELALAIENLHKSGCLNVNLVGGEPTPWLEQWLEVFTHVDVNIPVVWNSNSYYSRETEKLLAGFVDVYLLDFKYGNNKCAERISDSPNYWDVCRRNHLYGKRHGELLIRVLVLPGHLDCCTKVLLNWIVKHLGKSVRVNVMFQYRPEWRAKEVPELGRQLTEDERKSAVRLAKEVGLG